MKDRKMGTARLIGRFHKVRAVWLCLVAVLLPHFDESRGLAAPPHPPGDRETWAVRPDLKMVCPRNHGVLLRLVLSTFTATVVSTVIPIFNY